MILDTDQELVLLKLQQPGQTIIQLLSGIHIVIRNRVHQALPMVTNQEIQIFLHPRIQGLLTGAMYPEALITPEIMETLIHLPPEGHAI